MQPTARIINRSINWSASLKPRVGTTVNVNGSYYQNISGINGSITDPAHWFVIYSKPAESVTLDKTAADILGSDPNYYINLASEGIPDFPLILSAWVKIDNNPGTKYQPVDPLLYEPETKRLAGMNSPADFPNQQVKIKYM